jgi:hypothetical protein
MSKYLQFWYYIPSKIMLPNKEAITPKAGPNGKWAFYCVLVKNIRIVILFE